MAMIKTKILESGLVRTYSDTGHRLVQDGTGAVYDDAVDPAGSGRTYTESEELVEVQEREEDMPDA